MGLFNSLVTGEHDGNCGENYRDEIPDWFYDHCYKVVEVRGYPSDEEMAPYMPGKQFELRNRQKYAIGTIICYCGKDGRPPDGKSPVFPGSFWEEVIDKATWEYWQSILIVEPFATPQDGLMMINHQPCDNHQKGSPSYAREWWFGSRDRAVNYREEVRYSR